MLDTLKHALWCTFSWHVAVSLELPEMLSYLSNLLLLSIDRFATQQFIRVFDYYLRSYYSLVEFRVRLFQPSFIGGKVALYVSSNHRIVHTIIEPLLDSGLDNVGFLFEDSFEIALTFEQIIKDTPSPLRLFSSPPPFNDLFLPVLSQSIRIVGALYLDQRKLCFWLQHFLQVSRQGFPCKTSLLS